MPTMQLSQSLMNHQDIEPIGHCPQVNQVKSKASSNPGRHQNLGSVQGLVPSRIQNVKTESKHHLLIRSLAYVVESTRAPMTTPVQAQPVQCRKVQARACKSMDEVVLDSQEESEDDDNSDEGQNFDGYNEGYNDSDENHNDSRDDPQFNLDSEERREIEMDLNAGEQGYQAEVSRPFEGGDAEMKQVIDADLDLSHSATHTGNNNGKPYSPHSSYTLC